MIFILKLFINKISINKMNISCNICNHEFKSIYALNTHKKTAKYCLKLRNEVTQYKCDNCQKYFSTKLRFTNHEIICQNKKLHTKIDIDYNMKIISLQKDLDHANQIIIEKEKRIEKLESQLHEIALQATKKSNNTTNNNTTNTIINLTPLTREWLNEQANYLTKTHVEDGVHGYAELAAKHSFKDKVICKDLSRNIFQYIDEEGNKIKEKGHTLTKMFFQSIQEKNKEISEQLRHYIYTQIEKSENKQETMNLFSYINKYIANEQGIKRIVNDEHDILKDNFIRELCNRLNVIQ